VRREKKDEEEMKGSAAFSALHRRYIGVKLRRKRRHKPFIAVKSASSAFRKVTSGD